MIWQLNANCDPWLDVKKKKERKATFTQLWMTDMEQLKKLK